MFEHCRLAMQTAKLMSDATTKAYLASQRGNTTWQLTIGEGKLDHPWPGSLKAHCAA